MKYVTRAWTFTLVAVLLLGNSWQGAAFATQSVKAVNELVATGGISGAVTDRLTGKPMAGVTVLACQDGPSGPSYCFQQEYAHGVSVTNARGEYTIQNLPITFVEYAFYHVRFVGTGRYVDQWYDHLPDPSIDSRVKLTPGQTVSGINASMEQYAILMGRVTARNTGRPLPCVAVSVFDVYSNDNLIAATLTNQDGRYVFDKLRTQPYKLKFDTQGQALPVFVSQAQEASADCGTTHKYQSEFFNRQTHLNSAYSFNVTDTTTTTLNTTLGYPVIITGVVIADYTMRGLSNIGVHILTSKRESAAWISTDSLGRFTTGPLPENSYLVCFNHSEEGWTSV